MRGFAILLLIVVAFMVFGPLIKRYLQRKAAEKAEDFMRRAMGLPPREKRRRKKKESENNHRRYYSNTPPPRNVHPARWMKEYAEDVEFTETKFYSSETRFTETETKYKIEKQVSDAEWVEIKQKN